MKTIAWVADNFNIAIPSFKEGVTIEKAYKNINIKCIQEQQYGIFSEGGKSGKAKALPALPALQLPMALQSIPILGGSGGMPPQEILKITLSEIESGAF